jgi:hypothetical protein
MIMAGAEEGALTRPVNRKGSRRPKRPRHRQALRIEGVWEQVAVAVGFALLLCLPLSAEGPTSWASGLPDLVGVVVVTAAAGSFCHFVFGVGFRRLFFIAFAVRLAALGVLYILAPGAGLAPETGIETPSVFVWGDDVHYVGAAEELVRSGTGLFEEAPSQLRIHEKVLRVARLPMMVKYWLGPEQLWVRLLGILIGALTVVVTAMGLQGFLPPKAERWMVGLVCFGPQFLSSSILLYKEGYAIFAGALTLLACSELLKRRDAWLRGFLVLLLATAVMYWCRREFFLLVIAAGLGCYAFPRIGKGSWFAAAGVVAVALAAGLWLVGDELGIEERIESQLEEAETFADAKAFGWAAGLSGPARIVHIPIAFVNPPPFNLVCFVVPKPRDDEWFRTCFRELRTVQWWIMLPWILLAIRQMIRRPSSKLSPVVIWFLIVMVVTALIYNGNHPEAVRYRSTFLSIAVLLAGYGYALRRTGHATLLVRGTYAFGILIAIAMGMRA